MNHSALNQRGPLPVSPPSAFSERRDRLARRVSSLEIGSGASRSSSGGRCFVLSSGWARPRNFAHNLYPFRAESHFLYLVGRQLEGALLVFDRGRYALYLEPQDPELELWHGKGPDLEQLEEELGLTVRPLEELDLSGTPAVLPPQDEETAGWLSAVLGRAVDAQAGAHLEAEDAVLASLMVELRLVHDASAVHQLRSAGAATAAAHVAGMRATRGARYEREVRGAMEGELTARGLCPAYNSIVTVYGEILHASSSSHALSPGDLLLCDVGGETEEGFAADITRTWPVSGRFSRSQEEMYRLVLSVQKSAILQIRPGVRFSDLHVQAVRQMAAGLVEFGILRGSLDALFETGAASLFFPHGLGHLLGLDVHDMEDLGDRAGYDPGAQRSDHAALRFLRLDRELRENMVLTVEPGFYRIPGLLRRAQSEEKFRKLVNFDALSKFSDVRGIRIEDDVLVTRDGAEVLSHKAPKEVEELRELLSV